MIEIALLVFEIMVFTAMGLTLWRMAKGPTVADRMVAIDLLGLLVAVLMIAHVMRTGDETTLDVVLVFSVIAFFGTVSLAKYLYQKNNRQEKHHD